MTIEIGNKPLQEITAEELKQIIIIEGCCPSLQYWDEPQIVEFDNKMFNDCICLEYESHSKETNFKPYKSKDYCFYFKHKDLTFSYTKDYGNDTRQEINSTRLGLESLKYLIKQGYNISIY